MHLICNITDTCKEVMVCLIEDLNLNCMIVIDDLKDGHDIYCETQKTVNTWKISGMLIVRWPITITFRTREQTSKPQTNYRCCLRFSYLASYWLIPCNRITFRKYFWWSWFCEFHSKTPFDKSLFWSAIGWWLSFICRLTLYFIGWGLLLQFS